MSSFATTLKAFSGRWYARRIIRASQAALGVPFEIVPNVSSGIMGGVIVFNKASVVGGGGTGITITDSSSTITIAE